MNHVKGWVLFVAIWSLNLGVRSCPVLKCPDDFLPGNVAPLSCDISSCQQEFNSFTLEKKFGDTWKPVIVCSDINGDSCKVEDTGYEYTLVDRAQFMYSNGDFHIIVTNTMLEDSGPWRCSVYGTYSNKSNICEMIVYTELTRTDLTITPNNYQIIIGREYEYKCTAPKASPFFNTTWGYDGKNETGDTDYSKQNELGIWSIDSRITLTHTSPSPIVTCYMDKAAGNHAVSVKTEVSPSHSYFAAKIESFVSSMEKGAINASQDFFLSCVSSGTKPTIVWYKDTVPIDIDLCHEELNMIDGSFSYGQSKAVQSNITWNLPTKGYSCDDIGRFNGEYVCKASAHGGSEITEDISTPIKSTVEYSPIVNTSYIELETPVHTEIELVCEACAIPQEVYRWSSTKSRDGLDNFFNMTQIKFDVTKEDFYDTFFCTVTNTVGSDTVTFRILELVTTTATTTSTATNPSTYFQTDPIESNSSDLGFGVILSIGVTLGLFISALLFCGFVFYHRTYFCSHARRKEPPSVYQNENSSTEYFTENTTYEELKNIESHRINLTELEIKPQTYEHLTTDTQNHVEVTTYEELNKSVE